MGRYSHELIERGQAETQLAAHHPTRPDLQCQCLQCLWARVTLRILDQQEAAHV